MGKGKNAIVTGAGRGIGKSIALLLAEKGYNIGITYRNSQEGAKQVYEAALKKGVEAILIHADMSKIKDVESMIDTYINKFGKIDLLVNNAGITTSAPFLETSEELFDFTIATDLKGPYFCAQRAAKNMIEKGTKGVIINITSCQAEGCFWGASVYGAAKAALNKLTKHAALELAPYGIRVIAIAPGFTDVGYGDPNSTLNLLTKSKIPLGKYSSPDEMAGVVAFMASDEAGYITGTCIQVEGGSLLPVFSDPNKNLLQRNLPIEGISLT